MTASPAAITAAKSFATALASNIKLLNSFIAVERKIIQINPKFSTAELDNFLVQKGYNCTIDQVAQYGKPILSEPAHWAGSYHTQLCPQGETTWTKGPMLVIGTDGSVTMDGVTEPGVKFSFLNMTFAEAKLLFYTATLPAKKGDNSSNSANSKNRAKAFFGTYEGQKITGLVVPPDAPKTSKHESSFMKTFNQIAKYMGQINQAFMIYDLIKKATKAEEAGNEGEVMNVRGELSPEISDVSQSQGEVATAQQSEIETQAGENGQTLEEAADALREMQADDLGVDEVPDVAEAQLDEAGAEIGETSVADGGLDIGASVGEEAVGDLAVDALLDDALLLVLL
ncbi:MAG: hypothetical protein ACRBB0_26550 [Pelagimonas sp.]|uniref:hypothetical protein n=1 Tax=Pelagimonas sp. TaxID=2073170 RepID=UPI003D6B9CD9